MRGKGCPICARTNAKKLKTKTTGQFIDEMKLIDENIEVLGEYLHSHENIKCKCKKHNQIFYSMPTHLLQGQSGCKICKSEKICSKNTKTHEQFCNDVVKNNPNIKILGKYRGTSNTIEVQCKKCGFIWNPNAGSVVSGFGCPKCVGRHKTTREFCDEIYKINPDIEIIGEYINTSTKIKCRCKICNHIWRAKPDNLHVTGCPSCKISHGERLIVNFLNKNNINYEQQKTFIDLVGVGQRKLSYDFYLPDYNKLIEFQGEQHFRPVNIFGGEKQFKIQKEHDIRKKNYAKLHNITLIEICYYEIDKIDDILNSIINLDPVEITV